VVAAVLDDVMHFDHIVVIQSRCRARLGQRTCADVLERAARKLHLLERNSPLE
jgi:hypothetical protein